MKKNVIALLSVVLAMAMLICACSGKTESQQTSTTTTDNTAGTSTGEPTSKQIDRPLHFRIKTEADTLDPHKTSGTGDPQTVQYQVYESLFREEVTGEVVPALAESYSFNADNTEMTLQLRKDVTFHDGTPMTADDVVFSLNRSMSTGYNGVYVDAIKAVEKVSDYEVKVILKYAYTPVVSCLSSLSTAIVPKAYVEKNGDDILSRQPMGTGAYQFVSWTSGTEIVFKAYENYWRGKAAMDNQELDFVILPASLVGNGLRFYKLYQEEIVLVMPGKFHEDHSTAFYSKNGKEYVDLSAMGNESFLGYKPNNTMQTVTMDFCRDAGFAPQIVFYSSSPEIVCSMAQCGMGIGFVPSLVQAYYPSETTHLAYCSIENQQAFRDYVIAFKRSRMLSDAGKSFIELSKHLHSVADFPISDMKLEL